MQINQIEPFFLRTSFPKKHTALTVKHLTKGK